MNVRTADGHTGRIHEPRWRKALRHPNVRVALVAAACLMVGAIVAKNVLDVQLDFVSQLGALWVWLAYTLSGRTDRRAELGAMLAAVLVTAAILVFYAL